MHQYQQTIVHEWLRRRIHPEHPPGCIHPIEKPREIICEISYLEGDNKRLQGIIALKMTI